VGRISRSQCTSQVADTASGRILTAFRSRLLASAPTAVSRSAWRLLTAAITTVGISTWRAGVAAAVGISSWWAGATALWIASVGDNAASTYDFHANLRHRFVCLLDYFAFLTHPFCIPSTSIYMSFRAAQDHNKVVGRDTTSSVTSSI
jgi:hypothetical protein